MLDRIIFNNLKKNDKLSSLALYMIFCGTHRWNITAEADIDLRKTEQNGHANIKYVYDI